jgi:hypothetical protein
VKANQILAQLDAIRTELRQQWGGADREVPPEADVFKKLRTLASAIPEVVAVALTKEQASQLTSVSNAAREEEDDTLDESAPPRSTAIPRDPKTKPSKEIKVEEATAESVVDAGLLATVGD